MRQTCKGLVIFVFCLSVAPAQDKQATAAEKYEALLKEREVIQEAENAAKRSP